MFTVDQPIYLRKYMGYYLVADTKVQYNISCIEPRMIKNKFTKCYEKYAILSNGKYQILYSYDSFTKQYEYFVEEVPYCYKWYCCF